MCIHRSLFQERLIYIRVRDDITGGINYDQCSEVMKQSRKIIIVLSNSFLREPECIAEATHAGKLQGVNIKQYMRLSPKTSLRGCFVQWLCTVELLHLGVFLFCSIEKVEGHLITMAYYVLHGCE